MGNGYTSGKLDDEDRARALFGGILRRLAALEAPTGTSINSLIAQVGATAGMPTGGTTGQVLKKNSSTNYDASWGDDLSVVEGSANNPHTTQTSARESRLPKNWWRYTGTAPADDPTNWLDGDEWISE